MKTSIIILTYNKLDYTKLCIESIRRYTGMDSYEIIVVDNNSTDGTVDWLKEQADIRCIFNETNQGFPRGCNQGIEIATGENILLLNNDVIVTTNWLDNLVSSLYSSPEVGAVGAVTNNCSYYQTIPVEYKTVEEMQAFAELYNQYDESKWEERLKLIGFCMLIKKDVVEKIGPLDERFTPGNFEDDDYSLRIRKAGYKLILCKDTFIHHFGSTSFKDNKESFINLLSANEEKFEEKWTFNPTRGTQINHEIVNAIDCHKDKEFNILEINCGCGGTLLKIKNKFQNANLYGIEKNQCASQIAETFVTMIQSNNVNAEDLPYLEHFDYIILTNSLENESVPYKLLERIKRYLKSEGTVLTVLSNMTYIGLINKIIDGHSIYDDGVDKYFTLSEIQQMFDKAGYEDIQVTGLKVNISEKEQQRAKEFSALNSHQLKPQYQTKKYLIKATKNVREDVESLEEILNNLFQGELTEITLNKLEMIRIDEVIEFITSKYGNNIELLNHLAVLNFQYKKYDSVLPFLNKAFELNKRDVDTLYNLAQVMMTFGEKRLALQYLEMIEDKDDKILALIDEIVGKDFIGTENTFSDTDEIREFEQNDVIFTGERLVINKQVKEKLNNVLEEHVSRYEFACNFVQDKIVLDAACGAGYGTKMLGMAGAKTVVGIDISQESIEAAIPVYKGDNVTFLQGDVNHLPFKDSSFDVVVSFETIEHIKEGGTWIKESVRVLKEEGLFIVSTPNRNVTNPGIYLDERPLNPHHQFEYNIPEFIGELLKEYDILNLYGQTFINDKDLVATQLLRQLRKLDTNYVPNSLDKMMDYKLVSLGEVKNSQPMYLVAVCKKKSK